MCFVSGTDCICVFRMVLTINSDSTFHLMPSTVAIRVPFGPIFRAGNSRKPSERNPENTATG
jgi:hypothetical protein